MSGCSINGGINGDAVDLVGSGQIPGSGGGSGAGAGGGAVAAPDPCPGGALVILAGVPRCLYELTRPGEEVVVPVSLSDIASFRPTAPAQRMEPDGWTIAGLHTNFYALTGTHTVPGTLFGQPAEVRFTPVSYLWDYGDGSSVTLSTRGGTWAQLGVREFDRTPTSHVYAREGDYLIRLSVAYRADYRYAGSAWVPVAGRITLPANELRITAGAAKTVLVQDDCRVNPRGPGC